MPTLTSTGRRRRVVAAAAVALALAGCIAAARAPHARASVAGALPPIVSSDRGAFVPALGDWEGTVDGYPASFELVYEPGYVAFDRPPYGYEDLTTIDPSSCPPAPDEFSVSVVGDDDLTPLGPGGSFPLARQGISGGIVGSSQATLTSSFDTQPGRAGCGGTLTRIMRPAIRRTVQDGTWRLRFSDHESETFTVSAGGRAATGIDFPSALASCGGPHGNLNLFIAPQGTASDSGPRGSFAMHLTFTAANRASGRITLPGGRCGEFPLRMAAAPIAGAPPAAAPSGG